MRIGILHTAASNVPLFEAAAQVLGLSRAALVHEVRPDLLAAAQKAGYATPAVIAEAARALEALGEGLDGVLLNCSTLGEATEAAEARLGKPVAAAEAALLREALAAPGPVLILCTAPTTLEPTGRRLRALAAALGVAAPPLRLVEGAWARFMAGEAEAHRGAILVAMESARAEGFRSLALAQSSMTPAAAGLAPGLRPLTPPEAALRAILRRL